MADIVLHLLLSPRVLSWSPVLELLTLLSLSLSLWLFCTLLVFFFYNLIINIFDVVDEVDIVNTIDNSVSLPFIIQN